MNSHASHPQALPRRAVSARLLGVRRAIARAARYAARFLAGGASSLSDDDPWTVSGSDIYNNNSGNVGIGTTTPSQQLDVGGNVSIKQTGSNVPTIYTHDPTGYGELNIQSADPSHPYSFLSVLGNNAGDMVVFGMADAPDYSSNQFYVGIYGVGSGTMVDFSTYNAALAGGVPLHFQSYGGDYDILPNGGGKVGIGTTSPAHTLDVVGDGNFSGALSANGQACVGASRQIATTLPLTGGGDLSANRTLAINDFSGDSGSGGTRGAVPAPAAGDAAAGKFLKADGTWAVPQPVIPDYPDTIASAWLKTLSGMTYCHRVIYAYGYWWAFGYNQVYRVSPTDGTYTACTGVPAQHIYDAIAVNGKLYYTYGPISGAYALHVDQIDPATLIATNVVNDGTHCAIAGQNSMCSDGTYLWVTTWDYSAGPPVTGSKLLKYTLAGVYQATCAVTDGTHTMQLAHCCRYDGTRIIATSAASTANLAAFGITGAVTDYLEIAFIDPAAMTVSASHVFPSNADAAFTDAFAVTENFVWCGSEVSGNMVKFAKSGLAVRTVLLTGALASSTYCYEVYNDGRFLWMGFYGAGVIVRINPFTGAMYPIILPPGQPSVNSIWADDAGQNICFGNWLSFGAGTTVVSSTPLAALQVP